MGLNVASLGFQPNPRHVLDLGTAVGPQIYRILRERIIRNDIEPGARIFEAQVAAEFSVSRQPVREAIIKLSMEGLANVRPQHGTFVRKIAISDVLGARFVREAIEAGIVNELAASPAPGLVAELRGQLVEQRKAVPHNPQRFIELDDRFHRTLAEAAGKTYARDIIEDIKAQMDRVRYLSVRRFPMEKLVRQHTAIVDAIAAADAPAAEAAVRLHLREILNDLPAIAASKPEFFEPAGR